MPPRSRPQSAGPSRGSRGDSGYPYPHHAESPYDARASAFSLRQQQLTKLSQNKTSPKWSFAGRRPGSGRGTTPGPGAYTVAAAAGTERRSPAFGFGTSTRELSRGGSQPGPGQYKPQARPRSANPAYGFGSSTRSQDRHEGTPGPGAYGVPAATGKLAAPAYSVTPRRDGHGFAQDGPGPGAYTTRPEGHVPSFGFGSADREGRYDSFSPGPGAYDPYKRESTPAYSMYFRHDLRNDYATPGPGAYAGMYTQFGY